MKAVKIISAFFTVCLLSSCIQDAIDTSVISKDRVTEVAKDDPDKVFSATIAAIQNNLQQYVQSNLAHNYFGQKSFDYLTSLMGNDMIMTGRFNMSLYHYLLDYYQQDYVPSSNRWYEYYDTIKLANDILRDTQAIDPDGENADVQYYAAIARGFRGYAYLQLANLYQFAYYTGADDTKWGKGAKYDHSQDPCVPIILEDTEGDQPRSTVDKVYEQLIGDLESAYETFKALGVVKTSAPTDMDGCVCAMYLARAYMNKHDWTNALKYAQVVIDNFDVLKSEAHILQGFSDINLPDVVFGADITTDNSTTYMSFFSQMDVYGDGYAGIGVWRAAFKPLVDRIADNDIRLNWWCCDRSTGIDYNGGRVTLIRDTGYGAPVEYQSVKFIGAGRDNIIANKGAGTGWELGDYIYLRSEEAYLMKAEILAHKNDANAVNVLNEFMQTRQPDYNYTFTTKAALIEEIIFQKRVELWGEGLEWLDNRRLNIPVDRTNTTWGTANNHYAGARIYVEQEDYCMRYQLPISEIENNQMITPADQNPVE